MAPAPQFLGPDGLPIVSQALTQPIAKPQIGGVRNIFSDFVAPSLTPERLVNVLRESAEGYGHDDLTMSSVADLTTRALGLMASNGKGAAVTENVRKA